MRWYERRGYTVLDRNWRSASGELDLIVADGDAVVVVEVKARADERFGPAAAAVGADKQRRIRRLALEWLAEHPDRRGRLRFDVVAVTGTTVRVVEGAF